jgi:D-arabinose 1-dehydrogenase-like Zn-dependent alcohol dehydrogenase
VVGVRTTVDPYSPGASFDAQVLVCHLVRHQIEVHGSHLGTAAELDRLLAFVHTQCITPHIGVLLPLAEAATAFEAMWAGYTGVLLG